MTLTVCETGHLSLNGFPALVAVAVTFSLNVTEIFAPVPPDTDTTVGGLAAPRRAVELAAPATTTQNPANAKPPPKRLLIPHFIPNPRF